jgi:coenzyme F420 hydrogenase subunit beta
MKRFESLKDIVENGFCLSCGLCKELAPEGVITMAWAPNGQLRPNTARALTADEDAAIVEICPGINQTGPFESDLVNPHPLWGDMRRVVMGYATDPDTRFRASTGGVMTSINRYLLESGRVSFVLQVRASDGVATDSEAVLIRNPADLIVGSQSRYASSAPLAAVRAALELNEPFAVSLKPCDIAGVRNLQRVDERARRLIVYTQAFFCGTVTSLETTKDFLRREGVDPDKEYPETLRWRGNGCPGPTLAVMPDGREVTGLYMDMWDKYPWTTQFRCKICPDAIGLQADLTTGDAWPNAVAEGESAGTNVIVARTAIGEDVLAECERLGYLATEAPVEDVLDFVQPHQAILRKSFSTRLAGAVVSGTPMPNFTALADQECAAQLTPAELASVFQGTLERKRAGQGDERVSMEEENKSRMA